MTDDPSTGAVGTGAGDGVRVSMRELWEVPWRALYAAGLSTGEARPAADAAAFTQLHLGRGLDVVVDEVDRLPHPKVGGTVAVDGGMRVLDDGAGRGLVLQAQAAVDLVLADSGSAALPVFLPQLAWHPIVGGVLACRRDRAGSALVAVEVTGDGRGVGGVSLAGDGGLAVLDAATADRWLVGITSTVGERPGTRSGAQGPGLLIAGSAMASGVPSPAEPSHPIERLESDRRAALRGGVLVPNSVWQPVYERSRRLLVPDG